MDVNVEGRVLRLSSPERVLWPGTAFTKGWLVAYYTAVAPVLLPHLAGHPVTLHRFPEGVSGPHFFQTRVPPHPDWLRTVTMRPARTGKVFDVAVLDDVAGLVWAANLSTIELHPYLARADDLDRPRSVVFDLDPGPGVGMAECCRVALRLRSVLDDLGLAAVAKTSGVKGLHVHVPLNTPHAYEDTKAFARAVAALLVAAHPGEVVDKMTRSLRTGKVFVDWSQNDAGKSTVAPYSLRGLSYPTVSTPLRWDEVERAVSSRDPAVLTFSPGEALRRAADDGDLFAPVATLEQRLPVTHEGSAGRRRPTGEGGSLMADQARGGSGGGRAGVSDSRPVADVMSRDLVTVSSDATVTEAARLMRDHDIGPVLVMDGDRLTGIVTDRDIAVRAVAEGRDVNSTPVSEVATRDLTTVSPDDTLDAAAEAMRGDALRRLVVVEGGRPVGILSLGDLAATDEAADDAGIALSDVSAAPPQE